MEHSLAKRMFERIDLLLPALGAVQVCDSFFAPPPVAGDLTSTARVTRVGVDVFALELMQDQVGRGHKGIEQPWLTFRVDLAQGEAQLTAYIFGDDVWTRPSADLITSREESARIRNRDVFATNWLANMLNRGVVFETHNQTEGAYA